VWGKGSSAWPAGPGSHAAGRRWRASCPAAVESPGEISPSPVDAALAMAWCHHARPSRPCFCICVTVPAQLAIHTTPPGPEWRVSVDPDTVGDSRGVALITRIVIGGHHYRLYFRILTNWPTRVAFVFLCPRPFARSLVRSTPAILSGDEPPIRDQDGSR
jgi:hypothetical protein